MTRHRLVAFMRSLADRVPPHIEDVPLTGGKFVASMILLLAAAIAPVIAVGLTAANQSTPDETLRAVVVLGLFWLAGMAVGVLAILTGHLYSRPGEQVGFSVGLVGLAVLLPRLVPTIAGYPVAVVVVVATCAFIYPSLPFLVPLTVRRYRRTRREAIATHLERPTYASVDDVVRSVVDLLTHASYDEVAALGGTLSARDIQTAVRAHEGTLIRPKANPGAVVTPVSDQPRPTSHVAVPLSTAEESRPDLTVELWVTEDSPGTFRVEILGLHAPHGAGANH